MIASYNELDDEILYNLPLDSLSSPLEVNERVGIIGLTKEGIFEYKFVTETGDWFCDPTKPMCEHKNVPHYLL